MITGKQFSLFKGKRQRGVAPPPPLEFALHATLADICRRWINPRWRFSHLPFGEKRDVATGARLKRLGVTPGWPDFLFVGPGAQVFWLELKRPKSGRLSEAQGDIIGHLVACGFGVLVTTSIDDAVATLKQAGILRANVEVV
jgi:hypothetical protein